MFAWLRRSKEREEKSSSLDLLRHYLAGAQTAAGENVTVDNALGVTTVLRCVKVLGNGCSQIPFKLYQRSADGKSRTVINDGPLAKLIYRRPNSWQGPAEWRRTMTMHAALCNFGLSLIVRSRRGEPLELIPIEPGWIEVKQRTDWTLEYTISYPDGRREKYEQSDVFVLRGPTWDSVKGLAAVRYAREAIGLRLAIDKSQAKLFSNGARPGGVLAAKTPMKEDQLDKLAARWNAFYGGSDNAGKTALLNGDLSWLQLGMSNSDAQTQALRGQQIEEICRAFDVFPQMVGYSGDKTPTYASAEQFFINHVVHTLQPWHIAWEEAMATQLLTDLEAADGLYFKFTVQGLLRGTAKERAEVYNLLSAAGVVTANEIRAWEEMDEKPELDRFRIPLNTTVLDDDGMPVIPDKAAPPAAA